MILIKLNNKFVEYEKNANDILKVRELVIFHPDLTSMRTTTTSECHFRTQWRTWCIDKHYFGKVQDKPSCFLEKLIETINDVVILSDDDTCLCRNEVVHNLKQ